MGSSYCCQTLGMSSRTLAVVMPCAAAVFVLMMQGFWWWPDYRETLLSMIQVPPTVTAHGVPMSTTTTNGSNSQQQQQQQSSVLLHEDLALSGYADEVWRGLLQSSSSTTTSELPAIVVEVGMHRAAQCLQAAKMGFEAHCLEPSPRSFQLIERAVRTKATPEVQRRIHLYNIAAGSVESTVPFVASGGTGDHIGQVNMWKMEKMDSTNMQEAAAADTTTGTIVQVPTRPLDAVLREAIPPDAYIYLLKIDTQGFEPQVFAGLNTLLSQHRIQYILTEFWPRGMDILTDETSSSDRDEKKCVGVPLVLQKLLDYGYRLYVLPAQAHPKAPAHGDMQRLQKERPLDDLQKYCQWYYELEDRFPSDEYKMGYWTDILALAPGMELPQLLLDLPTYVK